MWTPLLICKMLPFETFVNDDESDVRCLVEPTPETTTTTIRPIRTSASPFRPVRPDSRSGITATRRSTTRLPRTTAPPTTLVPLTPVTITPKTKPSRNLLRQASFIAYRDCQQQNVVNGKFFYNICEWIRQFIRWRWRTFKTWSTYTKDISFDLYDMPQQGSCWANIRGCPKKNQV